MHSHREAFKAGATFAMLLILLMLMAALTVQAAPATSSFAPSSPQHQGWQMVWLRAKTDQSLGGGWLEMPIRRDAKLADELDSRLGDVAGVSSGELGDQNRQLHLYRLEEINLKSLAGQLELQPKQQLFLTSNDLLY